MTNIIWVGMAFFALAGIAQADVHKCEKDGKTVYQDQPCAPGSDKNYVDEQDAANRRETQRKADDEKRQQAQEQAKLDSERRAAAAAKAKDDAEAAKIADLMKASIADGDARVKKFCDSKYLEPSVGMPEPKFLNCTLPGFSHQLRVNITTTMHGVTKQYVYGNPPSIKFYYLSDEVLTSIQE